MRTRDFSKVLERLDELPDSAVVPIVVAAQHDHISPRTVRRNYPLVKLTTRIRGVRVLSMAI